MRRCFCRRCASIDLTIARALHPIAVPFAIAMAPVTGRRALSSLRVAAADERPSLPLRAPNFRDVDAGNYAGWASCCPSADTSLRTATKPPKSAAMLSRKFS